MAGQRLLADILVAYFETVLCEMESDDLEGWTADENWLGGGSHTIDTSAGEAFETLVGRNRTFPPMTQDGPEVEATTYAFLSLPAPSTIPPVPLPAPLSLYLDYKRPDPSAIFTGPASHLNLKPVPFCADANDPDSPLTPKESSGWTTMVWKNEKHFWIADEVGARIVVDVKANEGRSVHSSDGSLVGNAEQLIIASHVASLGLVTAGWPCSTSGRSTCHPGRRIAGWTIIGRVRSASRAIGQGRTTSLGYHISMLK